MSDEERTLTIGNIVDQMVLLLAPVIPHMCEEINKQFGNHSLVSIQEFSKIEISEAEELIFQQDDFISKVIKDIDNIKKILDKPPQKINIYVNPPWKNILYQKSKSYFQDKVPTMPEIMKLAKIDPNLQKNMKNVSIEAKLLIKSPSILKSSLLTVDQQQQALEEFQQFMKNKFKNAEIRIYVADKEGIYDPKSKAKNARPMKPALFLE